MNDNLSKHRTNCPCGYLCKYEYNLSMADCTLSKIFKFIQ